MANRRQFITGVAVTSTVTIAGCSSQLTTQKDPEEVVEQYYTALQNGDTESANEVLHPEHPEYPIEEENLEQRDFTVNEINQVSPREVIEQHPELIGVVGGVSELTEEEIEEGANRLREPAEEIVDETGSDDYAWVVITVDENSEESKDIRLTIEDDGNWLIYQ